MKTPMTMTKKKKKKKKTKFTIGSIVIQTLFFLIVIETFAYTSLLTMPSNNDYENNDTHHDHDHANAKERDNTDHNQGTKQQQQQQVRPQKQQQQQQQVQRKKQWRAQQHLHDEQHHQDEEKINNSIQSSLSRAIRIGLHGGTTTRTEERTHQNCPPLTTHGCQCPRHP